MKLPCVFNNPFLPNEVDLDFSGITEVRFYGTGDFLGQFLGFQVGDGIRVDEHPDFPSRG